MVGWSISKRLLAVSIVSVAAGAALPARAGSTGNGAAGGGFPQYTYEADANRLCKGDTVVWGSSAHKGIYYIQGCWSPAHRRVLRLQGRREEGGLQDLGVIHCGPVQVGCAPRLHPPRARHPHGPGVG